MLLLWTVIDGNLYGGVNSPPSGVLLNAAFVWSSLALSRTLSLSLSCSQPSRSPSSSSPNIPFHTLLLGSEKGKCQRGSLCAPARYACVIHRFLPRKRRRYAYVFVFPTSRQGCLNGTVRRLLLLTLLSSAPCARRPQNATRLRRPSVKASPRKSCSTAAWYAGSSPGPPRNHKVETG